MTDQLRAFFASLRTSGGIAKKRAVATKLRLFDLKEAQFKLGNYALENQIAREECAAHFAAIAQVDDEIAAKRTAVPADANATLTERAMLTAQAAKDRASLEALLFRRKGLVTSFGEALSAFEFEDPEATTLAAGIATVAASIESIEAEAVALEQNAPRWVRNRMILAGVVLLGLFLCYQTVHSLFGVSQARRSGSAALSSSLKGMDSLQRDIRATELRIKQQQALEAELRAKNLAESQIRSAEENLKQKQREERQQQARNDALQARAAQDAERAASAAAKAEAAHEREIADERNNAGKKSVEQADRAVLADRVFGAVNLQPKISLSRALVANHANAEVRGKGYDEVVRLKEAKDWLGLLSKLTERSHTEYPSLAEIEGAARQLYLTGFRVLCKTTLKTRNGSDGLMGDELMVLMLTYSDETFAASRSFSDQVMSLTPPEPHPDGIGYFFRWTPEQGDCALFYGPRRKTQDYLNRIHASVSKEKQALFDKLALGEIDEATKAKRLEALRKKVRDDVFRWAMAQ